MCGSTQGTDPILIWKTDLAGPGTVQLLRLTKYRIFDLRSMDFVALTRRGKLLSVENPVGKVIAVGAY